MRAAAGIGALTLAMGTAGCGQRGPLYLPSEPAAAQRATLPQTVLPSLPRDGGGSADRKEGAPVTSPAPADASRDRGAR